MAQACANSLNGRRQTPLKRELNVIESLVELVYNRRACDTPRFNTPILYGRQLCAAYPTSLLSRRRSEPQRRQG